MQTQTITIDTIMGPKEILAPEGWVFDKTATITWWKLLWATREGFTPFKLQRDKQHWSGKIDALSSVLATSLGMAAFYWEQTALEMIVEERK